MKKIFGILSLIAVLTVAFSSNASASVTDDVGVEFVVPLGSPEYASAVVTEVPTFGVVFNPTDVTVIESFASREVVDSTDFVSRVFDSVGTNYAKVFLPIEVGLLSASSNNENTITIEYFSHYTYIHGYEAPDIVKRISANVGKLTPIPIES